MRLRLDIAGSTFAIDCRADIAPRTLAALGALLPMAVRMQTPKIAGSHVYWQVPLVEAVEGAADVMDAPPGAFLYWPERQFLELIFAPLQAETATVTMLGQVAGDLAPLRELGGAVRRRHGQGGVSGILTADGPLPFQAPDEPPAPARLRHVRKSLWNDCPGDIDRLMDDRGLMHPAGPLYMAESEARGMHETLWRLYCALATGEDERSIAFAAGLTCEKAVARLGGFCHLTGPADAVGMVGHELEAGGASLRAVLREGVLIAGAISAWLDLRIPWDAVNETIRRSVSDEAGRTGTTGQGTRS